MKELGSLTWMDYWLQKELEFCVKDHYIMGSRVESDQGSVTLSTLMGNKVRVLLAFVCATRDFFHACCFKKSRHVFYGCLFNTRLFPSQQLFHQFTSALWNNFSFKFSFCNFKVVIFFMELFLVFCIFYC
jgi:hypothetical protein